MSQSSSLTVMLPLPPPKPASALNRIVSKDRIAALRGVGTIRQKQARRLGSRGVGAGGEGDMGDDGDPEEADIGPRVPAPQSKSDLRSLYGSGALASEESGESLLIPWWRKIVLDQEFRRQICSVVTKELRRMEQQGIGKPVAITIPGAMWNPKAPQNRVPGNGLTYHWIPAFPPCGYVQVSPSLSQSNSSSGGDSGALKPLLEGKFCVNVFAEPEEAPLNALLLPPKAATSSSTGPEEESELSPSGSTSGALFKPKVSPSAATAQSNSTESKVPITFNSLQATIHPQHGGMKTRTNVAPVIAPGSPAGVAEPRHGPFIGALRCSLRLVRWRILSTALHTNCNDIRLFPMKFLSGIPKPKPDAVVGYQREDVTAARREYLFNSDLCKKAVRKIFVRLEKDINGRVTKNAFVEFTLHIINLFMPSFFAQSNIDLAEDEWLCRGSKDKPDFYLFYRFYFDLPLFICRTEHVNEESYCGFWEQVERWIYHDGIVNCDRYSEHALAAELMHDSDVMKQPALRRPLLVYRKAEMVANKKEREKKLQKLRTKMHQEQASAASSPRSPGRDSDDEDRWRSQIQSTAFGGEEASVRRYSHVAPSSTSPKPQRSAAANNTKLSSLALYEDTYTVPESVRDEMDDILDFCSEFSSSDFDDEPESVRKRFNISMDLKVQREQYRQEKRKVLEASGGAMLVGAKANRAMRMAMLRSRNGKLGTGAATDGGTTADPTKPVIGHAFEDPDVEQANEGLAVEDAIEAEDQKEVEGELDDPMVHEPTPRTKLTKEVQASLRRKERERLHRITAEANRNTMADPKNEWYQGPLQRNLRDSRLRSGEPRLTSSIQAPLKPSDAPSPTTSASPTSRRPTAVPSANHHSETDDGALGRQDSHPSKGLEVKAEVTLHPSAWFLSSKPLLRPMSSRSNSGVGDNNQSAADPTCEGLPGTGEEGRTMSAAHRATPKLGSNRSSKSPSARHHAQPKQSGQGEAGQDGITSRPSTSRPLSRLLMILDSPSSVKTQWTGRPQTAPDHGNASLALTGTESEYREKILHEVEALPLVQGSRSSPTRPPTASNLFELKSGAGRPVESAPAGRKGKVTGGLNIIRTPRATLPYHRTLPYVNYTSSLHVPGVEETVLQRHLHRQEQRIASPVRDQSHSGLPGAPHPTVALVKKLIECQKDGIDRISVIPHSNWKQPGEVQQREQNRTRAISPGIAVAQNKASLQTSLQRLERGAVLEGGRNPIVRRSDGV